MSIRVPGWAISVGVFLIVCFGSTSMGLIIYIHTTMDRKVDNLTSDVNTMKQSMGVIQANMDTLLKRGRDR